MSELEHRTKHFCVHYRPPTEFFACAAGVSWEHLRSIPPNERPCHLTAAPTPRPGARDCEHRKLPMSLQGECNARYWEAKFATAAKAAEVIGDVRKVHRGKYVALIVQCPVCKGSLHVTTFPNGAATGKCETKDCADLVMRP